MPLTPGMKRLYSGNYNAMHQDWQEDGSVIVTLQKTGDPVIHQIHVTDLFGPNEKVLDEKVISDVTPKHILDRIEEANATTIDPEPRPADSL